MRFYYTLNCFLVLLWLLAVNINYIKASGMNDREHRLNDNESINIKEIESVDMIKEYFMISTTHNDDIQLIPGAVAMVLTELHSSRYNNEEIILELISPSKERIFSIPMIKYTKTQYYALLPISFYSKEGVYQIKILDTNKDKKKDTKVLTQSSVRVGHRAFKKDYVVLNKKLSTRKTTAVSPAVVQESKNIWALTEKINRNITYSFENFIFPVKDYKYITGMFADKRLYTYPNGKNINETIHGGIDIASPTGTPVYASATGKVVFSQSRIVTGNSVVLEHFPGLYSMYYHLDNIDVPVGKVLAQGEKIGTVGSTGFATGPHLHWEMRMNNVRVDPLLFLDRLDKIKTLDIR